MTDAQQKARSRPMSPHVQVWRWHLTMFCSIANRAAGVALYGGALILAAWAVSLAMGPGTYTRFMVLMASPVGRLVLFGLTVSLFFHLAAGVRHLVWDAGKGFDPKLSGLTGGLAIAFAVVASIAVWGLAAMTGAL